MGMGGGNRAADLVALDDAMNALARFDPRKVQVVEMRFFGGLSLEETAEVLKISSVTVKRDLRTAKAWLYRELTAGTRTMDSERWKRIDSLLHAAWERPPAARAEFLRQACAGDEALEREVRSLMASDQEAGSFLDNPAIEVAARGNRAYGLVRPDGLPLQDPGDARRRRHGSGVQGVRHQARPARGPEIPAAASAP